MKHRPPLAAAALSLAVSLTLAAAAQAEPTPTVTFTGASPTVTLTDEPGTPGPAVTATASAGAIVDCGVGWENVAGTNGVYYGYQDQGATSSQTLNFNLGPGSYQLLCNTWPAGDPSDETSVDSQTYTVGQPYTITNGQPATPGTPSGYTQAADSSTDYTAQESPNWSGYIVPSAGGSFTGATGTFTLPSVENPTAYATPAGTAAYNGPWVGLDGWGQAYLIQAGVELSPGESPQAWYVDQSTSSYTADGYAAQYVPITIAAGDQVTVTIAETNGATWTIQLEDDTNGQSFSVPVQYTGPANTAEWIDEAPGGGPLDFNEWPFAPPTTPVQWTDAATSGAAANTAGATLTELFQQGYWLTSASTFTAGAFTQTYSPEPMAGNGPQTIGNPTAQAPTPPVAPPATSTVPTRTPATTVPSGGGHVAKGPSITITRVLGHSGRHSYLAAIRDKTLILRPHTTSITIHGVASVHHRRVYLRALNAPYGTLGMPVDQADRSSGVRGGFAATLKARGARQIQADLGTDAEAYTYLNVRQQRSR